MATYTLANLFDDVNGAISFTEDVAALGTIPTDYYLQIPPRVKALIPEHFVEEIKTNGDDLMDFFVANKKALRSANVDEQTANFCTLLRWKMLKAGAVASTTEARSVHVNEYAETPGISDDDKRAVTFPNRDTTSFVGTYFENIVSVVAHVFRVRGHHWKEEYSQLYDRTWRCTTITVPNGVVMPSWEHISRTALHCFGIKALEYISSRAASTRKLAAGLLLRRSAAPAGSAPIRTAAAALIEMSSSTWYSTFLKHNEQAVKELFYEAERLAQAGLAAHINKGLYGIDADRVVGDEAKLKRLAPYILGWIDTLDDSEPIKRQKAITKRGQGSSNIRTQFANAVANEMRLSVRSKSVEAFFEPEVVEEKEERKESERRNSELVNLMRVFRVAPVAPAIVDLNAVD